VGVLQLCVDVHGPAGGNHRERSCTGARTPETVSLTAMGYVHRDSVLPTEAQPVARMSAAVAAAKLPWSVCWWF
jgi:hypothetical protein